MRARGRNFLGKFDFIIVGAGSAGCVLANRLSADPSNTVLLLEAGGDDNYFWIHIPAGYLFTMNNPRTDWCFTTEAEPGLNGRALAYPRGKVLGGCSAINGMIYMRGQARDYDHWRQLGNVGWAWDDVLPYFLKSEDQARGASEHHATGGEFHVEDMRLSWEILDAFRDAAAEIGIPPTDDFNTGNNEGCGYFQVNQRRGVRWTAAKGFLKPVMRRPNLTVLTHAHASGLTFEGKRCTGVEFLRNGHPQTATAGREVILATGAIGSPMLLQHSGIGPPDPLRENGIDVRHDMPGVGENLQDHLQIRAVFKVRNTTTLNDRARTRIGRIGIGIEYFLFKRGPLTMAPSQLGAFVKSDPDRETPNLEYHVQPLSLDRFGEPLHEFSAFTASVCNLSPESRGQVRISGPGALAKPSIRPNYLSAPADRRIAAGAVTLTRRICAAKALSRFEPEEYLPGVEFQTEEELAREAGNIGTTIFHPVGTCKMGSDPAAVVDARLRVHGIGGLRVADASIMPTITSGNTNAPTIMIAEKAAAMIIEDCRGNG
ncbi:MAG: GMC family oxidoreductase [Alphaproteobacteria bacterium]